MQEVFSKIIEKLEELRKAEIERDDLCDEEGCGDGEEIYEDGKSQGRFEQVVRIIEIVKQEAAEYNNGWIPCSERLPEERDWYLAVFEEVDTGFIGLPYIADYLMGSHTEFTTEDGWIIHNCSDREDESAEYYKNLRCVAWQPLPNPFQPKGEQG